MSLEGTKPDTKDGTLCDSAYRQVQNRVPCGDRKSVTGRPVVGRSSWRIQGSLTQIVVVSHTSTDTLKTLEMYILKGQIIWLRNHISGKLRECPQLMHEQDWLCDYPGSAKREKETFSG